MSLSSSQWNVSRRETHKFQACSIKVSPYFYPHMLFGDLRCHKVNKAPQTTEYSSDFPLTHLRTPLLPDKQINLYCIWAFTRFFGQFVTTATIILTNIYELKDVKELAHEKQWHLCVYMSISRLDRWEDPWLCLFNFAFLWHSTVSDMNQSLSKYSLNENEVKNYLRGEITFFLLFSFGFYFRFTNNESRQPPSLASF